MCKWQDPGPDGPLCGCAGIYHACSMWGKETDCPDYTPDEEEKDEANG